MFVYRGAGGGTFSVFPWRINREQKRTVGMNGGPSHTPSQWCPRCLRKAARSRPSISDYSESARRDHRARNAAAAPQTALTSCSSALPASLRLQRLHIRLAAQRHDRDLARAKIGKDHLHWRAVALQQGNVARLRAARGQIERRPGGGLGIVAQRAVGAPEIGPDVVLPVDRDMVRLLP